MKKILTAAFAAMAILAPSAIRADEPAKEYNMVITLQNGTTITLGHNDIKNITFDGEEISISGNVVNTIEEIDMKTRDNRDRIDMLAAMLDELHAYVDSNDAMLMDNINAIQTSLAALSDKVEASGAADISDLQNDIETLKEAMQRNFDELLNLHNMNEQEIYAALTRIEEVYLSIDGVNEHISQMYNSLMAEIDELRNELGK